MNKIKLTRTPIIKNKKADTVDFEPFTDWVVKLNTAKKIDVFELRNLFDGERILSELNIFIRPFRNKNAYVYPILAYLRYVISVGGLVSSSSLKNYKMYLDKEVEVLVNTKADSFSHCKAFLTKLMSSKVIKKEKLPINFKRGAVTPKATFAEIASRDISTFNSVISIYQDKISEYQSSLNLDPISAPLCFFCVKSMDVIYR